MRFNVFDLAFLVAVLLLTAAGVYAQVSTTETVTVVSADGTTLAPASAQANATGAAKGITTAEGVWTFGTARDANGDYPILLDGKSAGAGVLLLVANGHLYAKQGNAQYWVRWNRAWAAAAAAPVQGTEAKALSLAMVLVPIPDNSPAGTVIAKATVAMSPAGAKFTGALVSDNPIYTGRGSDVVLARALTPADDAHGAAVITAVQ